MVSSHQFGSAGNANLFFGFINSLRETFQYPTSKQFTRQHKTQTDPVDHMSELQKVPTSSTPEQFHITSCTTNLLHRVSAQLPPVTPAAPPTHSTGRCRVSERTQRLSVPQSGRTAPGAGRGRWDKATEALLFEFWADQGDCERRSGRSSLSERIGGCAQVSGARPTRASGVLDRI